MKKFWITILVVSVLLSVALAAREPEELASLTGLEGFFIVADLSGSDICNLAKDGLRTIAELGLRRNGIKILTKEEWLKTIGGQHLGVSVNVVGTQGTRPRAAYIHVSMGQ